MALPNKASLSQGPLCLASASVLSESGLSSGLESRPKTINKIKNEGCLKASIRTVMLGGNLQLTHSTRQSWFHMRVFLLSCNQCRCQPLLSVFTARWLSVGRVHAHTTMSTLEMPLIDLWPKAREAQRRHLAQYSGPSLSVTHSNSILR